MSQSSNVVNLTSSEKSEISPSGFGSTTASDGSVIGDPITNTSEFDEFWRAYPRKVGKLKARVAYQQITGKGKSVLIDGERLDLKASHAEIMDGLRRFISGMYNSRTGELLEETKFIPHATTWLNQGRWEDGE